MSASALELPPRDTELEAQLTRALDGSSLGGPCYAFQQIPSTMDVAHQLAMQGAPEGTCVWTEQQTSGRGRAGRAWSSPPGGIYLSLILRPRRPLHEVPQLALIAGLSLAQAVRALTGLSPSIRWPNDLLLYDEKLAGILTEAKETLQHGVYVIAGIGMNLATPASKLPEGATSLVEWIERAPDRFAFTRELFGLLHDAYHRWNDEGFAPIRASLLPWIGLFGRFVHLTTPAETVYGEAVDVDEAGRLVIRLESGLARAFDAGEVSLLR